MAISSPGKDLEKYVKPVVLDDGTRLRVRPICSDDEEKFLDFFGRLGPKTIYLRFHRSIWQLPREHAWRFCNIDYDETFALVATIGDGPDEKIVADGHYYRLPKRDAAEVALMVEDEYQSRGIGTRLMAQLVDIARDNGVHFFESEVLSENQAMMRVMKKRGFLVSQGLESGVYRVVLRIAPTQLIQARAAEAEKVATIASLRAFLRPRSIAVIGASQREGTVGNKVFHNIRSQGFSGVLYPVNPRAETVAGVKAYPSVLDIPWVLDLAVVIVPTEAVQQVLQECGRKGVRCVAVMSPGFAESGPEGLHRQEMLLETARSHGMLLMGPASMGIINTAPRANLNATASAVFPPAGNIALCCQGGALGFTILEYAATLNIGLSTLVSIGSRADISSNDLLQYWEEDPATDVILLYLESFGNPRKFARIARRVSQNKPVAVVKSGRTPAGSRSSGPLSWLLTAAETASESLFRQAGIIRVDTLEELLDVASVLAHQPLPSGRKVAILANGGGPAIVTAYACAAVGLELSALSDRVAADLQATLPQAANVNNPVDLTAQAGAEEYRQALNLLAEDPNVDSVIVLFIPPIVTQPEAVAGVIRRASQDFRRRGKTLVCSFMGSRGAAPELGSTQEGYVPCFAFPEATVAALARACDYAQWRQRPQGSIPELEGIDRDQGERIVLSASRRTKERPLWLDHQSITGLLEAYGVRVARATPAMTPEEAARAAEGIGFPVAVKLLSDKIVAHKTEFGGVRLDLRSGKEVERAFIQIRDGLARMGEEEAMRGVTVQEMVPGGVEAIVGVTQDAQFGPLVVFGTGGVYSELFKDVAFRTHPLTDVDARELIRSVKAHQLLEGWRGSRPSDVAALEDLLLRISAMVDDLPQIGEIDLNPVKVFEQGCGCVVVDARVTLS